MTPLQYIASIPKRSVGFKVSDAFQKLINRFRIATAWTSPRSGGKKFLTVKQVFDPTGAVGPYFFVERLGRNSVAFVCKDESRTENPYLVLRQYHSPCAEFVDGAFTGSIDKDLSVLGILSEELIEEAGYSISEEELKTRAQFKGLQYVCSNSNERVFCFLVDVTGLVLEPRECENVFEENSRMFWVNEAAVMDLCEWKARTIISAKPQKLPV